MSGFYSVKCIEILNDKSFIGSIRFGSFGMALDNQTFLIQGNQNGSIQKGESLIVSLQGKNSFGQWLCKEF